MGFPRSEVAGKDEGEANKSKHACFLYFLFAFFKYCQGYRYLMSHTHTHIRSFG